MERRTMLVLAAAASGMLPLAACGKNDGSREGAGGARSDASVGPTTLTITVWNYDKTPEFKALFTAFHGKYPQIKIQHVDILAENYSEKITAMLAGGDNTDVLTMKNVVDYSRYALRGQLLNVTDLAARVKSQTVSGLGSFTLDKKYFAIPYRQDFWLLYYNKDLFDKAGVAYPAGMTWSQYTDLAKKLTSGSGAAKIYGTYHHVWRSVVQAIAAAQTGGDQLSGKYDFMKRQYEMALDLQKAGATLDWSTANSQKISYRTMFENGSTAMLPMGTWYAASILQAKQSGASKVNWGFAPMPQLQSGGKTVTFGSPTAFAVNNKAKNKAAAKLFIEWAAGPEGANAIAALGVTPALQGDAVTSRFIGVRGMPTDDGSRAALRPDKVVLEMPISDKTSDIDRILREEHELIMSGEKSIGAGIASMNSRVKRDVLV